MFEIRERRFSGVDLVEMLFKQANRQISHTYLDDCTTESIYIPRSNVGISMRGCVQILWSQPVYCAVLKRRRAPRIVAPDDKGKSKIGQIAVPVIADQNIGLEG